MPAKRKTKTQPQRAGRPPKRLKSVAPPVSVLESVERQFDQAAAMLELDPNMLRIIKQPRRSVIMKGSPFDNK